MQFLINFSLLLELGRLSDLSRGKFGFHQCIGSPGNPSWVSHELLMRLTLLLLEEVLSTSPSFIGGIMGCWRINFLECVLFISLLCSSFLPPDNDFILFPCPLFLPPPIYYLVTLCALFVERTNRY